MFVLCLNDKKVDEAGFTLLELLLSLSLSVLVITLLNVGTNLIIKDWLRHKNRLDDEINLSLTFIQVERAVQGAFPHVFFEEDEEAKNKKVIYFEGGEHSLSWVSTFSPQHRSGLTAWKLMTDETGVILVSAPALVGDPEARFNDEHFRPVLPDYELKFHYLIDDRGEKIWVEEWSAKKYNSLPQAVHIVFTPTDKRQNDTGAMELFAIIAGYRHYSIRPIPYKNEI